MKYFLVIISTNTSVRTLGHTPSEILLLCFIFFFLFGEFLGDVHWITTKNKLNIWFASWGYAGVSLLTLKLYNV